MHMTSCRHRRHSFSSEAASTGQPHVWPDLPAFDRAEGCWFYTTSNERYFDATSGSGAISLQHGHPRVTDAVIEQVRRLCHTGSMIHAETRDRMVAKLTAFVPFTDASVLLAVTGAEAVEASMKVARAFTNRRGVIAFRYAYHGKTAGALAVTWREQFKQFSVVSPEDFFICPYHLHNSVSAESDEDECLDHLRLVVEELTEQNNPPAAILIEPMAVTEGMLMTSENFLKQVIETARASGSLVIFDEIWTGFGRSGTKFYSNRPELLPDLLVVGKGLANGFPVSAVLGDFDILASLPPSHHTSTFAGHPVGCAAACAVLDELEEAKPWVRSAEVGARLLTALRELEAASWLVSNARGEGTMLAFDCVDRDGVISPELCAAFASAAQHKGVLFHYGGYQGATIKIAPPPLTDEEGLSFLLGVINEVVDDRQLAY